MKESCGINHFIVYLFGWILVHFVGSTVINATFWITIKSHCTVYTLYTGRMEKGLIWDHRSFYHSYGYAVHSVKETRAVKRDMHFMTMAFTISIHIHIIICHSLDVFSLLLPHILPVLSLLCVIISAFTISLKPNVIVNSHQIFRVQKMMKLFVRRVFSHTHSLLRVLTHSHLSPFSSFSCSLCLRFESL